MSPKQGLSWGTVELALLVTYASAFEILVIWRGAKLSSGLADFIVGIAQFASSTLAGAELF